MTANFNLIEGLRQIALSYGVNPFLFVLIYFLSYPFYYYPLLKLRTFWSNRKNLKAIESDVIVSIIINRLAWASPYLYIIIFGENLPIWVYVAVFSYLTIGTIYFMGKMKENYK